MSLIVFDKNLNCLAAKLGDLVIVNFAEIYVYILKPNIFSDKSYIELLVIKNTRTVLRRLGI